jgi:hypothetical protein
MKIAQAISASLLIVCVCAQAAEPTTEASGEDQKMAEVTVSGIRDPELKPYRVISAGMDAFDAFRALAPSAVLRFRLSRKGSASWYTEQWEGVTLRLAGGETSIPVPLAADGTFALPRSQAAYNEDAELILNQKKASFRFMPEVRTPGLPADTLRLGDLRLKCQVLAAIGKKESSFAMRMALNTIMFGSDWCGKGLGKINFPIQDWSINTTVVYDGKQKTIPTRGYSFIAPIEDKSLPDDALIKFEFWSAASAERKREYLARWPIQLKSSMNKWAAGPVLRMTEPGKYRVVMALEPGNWKFNMFSPGGEISLGSTPERTAITLSGDHALMRNGRDLTMTVEQAGDYEFLLNIQNPDATFVNISRVQAAGAGQ